MDIQRNYYGILFAVDTIANRCEDDADYCFFVCRYANEKKVDGKKVI